MRYVVPDQIILEALRLAIQVEGSLIPRARAHATLMNQHELAAHTANAYLNCYAHLRRGTVMKATISAQGIRLMLDHIATQGIDDLLLALQALLSHIHYLETLYNRTRVSHVLRALHLEYSETVLNLSPPALPIRNFWEEVTRSIADTDTARRKRLSIAPKQPASRVRIVKDYNRNPDVVAEVLIRAIDTCEGCKTKAPFLRRSNGTPYLEVHHIIQLSAGGDDTVQNSEALCPNCHREKHFG